LIINELFLSINTEGTYPGMVEEKTLAIVMVDNNHGIGINVCKKPDKIIKYKGDEIKIKF